MKIFGLLVVAIMSLGLLSGCATTDTQGAPSSSRYQPAQAPSTNTPMDQASKMYSF